jgi:hypothetical protein
MANRTVHLPVIGFGQTLRKDAWWLGPALTVAVLVGFIVYATFRAFENAHYEYDAYLSPFYSPFIDTSWAKGWPIALSPAMLILAGPASFRFTCYYYRKAYYRAFWADPPACAVGEPRRGHYHGERRLLLFQNLHRFALYAAIVFLAFLWHDAVKGFIGWKDGGVHMGVGSLVLTLNCVLLSGYTFGCHSFRHLIGGGVNSYSTATLGGLRFSLWKLVSKLNERHMLFAWMSLFGVALTDLYVRMVSSGAISDVRLF